jgi:ubiquitin thioesterase OTU1
MDNLISIRREVNADNSCLFSSIAYLVDRDSFSDISPLKFREQIVEYLTNKEFAEYLLDLPKNEYIKEISKTSKWGGGIEIAIFSEIYQVKIASIDIKTGRVDIFGQDKNYEKIIYIVYTGIHYDPLVMNFDESSDPKSDITIFNANDDEIKNQFIELVKKIKEKGDYFDSKKDDDDNDDDEAPIDLQCTSCEKKFHNKLMAQIHARELNHWNFKEI